MQLYLVRHAQSSNNALWLETNSHKNRNPDPLLSDIGKQQVKHLAQFLKNGDGTERDSFNDPHNFNGFGITHIYCSLMLRAIETGMEISQTLGIPLTGWREIHETGGIISGDGEEIPFVGQPGSTRSSLQKNYPDLNLIDHFGEEGWWNSQPRESDGERYLRAKRVIDTLFERHGNTQDHVLMVTHGAFYAYLMQELLGMRESDVYFLLSNTAITRWGFVKDHKDETRLIRVLVYTNRVTHLPKELVTY